MSATQVRNISGALEAIDAAAHRDSDATDSPGRDDLIDVSQGLRGAVGELMDYIVSLMDDTYARLASEDIDDDKIAPLREAADNFRNEIGQFAPHLAADHDEQNPNPILGTTGSKDDKDADTSKSAKATK